MLFWLGLIVALFGGLLSVGFFRDLIRQLIPSVSDSLIDAVAVVLLVLGLIVSAVEHYREKTEHQLGEKSFRRLETFATEPRVVNFEKAAELLKNAPKGSVEIAPLQGSVEADWLADQLQMAFSAAGWKISRRKAGTDEILNAGIAVVTGSRSDGSSDKEGMLQLDEPAKTLRTVLTTCVSDNTRGGSFRTDSRMPSDASLILIGPKY